MSLLLFVSAEIFCPGRVLFCAGINLLCAGIGHYSTLQPMSLRQKRLSHLILSTAVKALSRACSKVSPEPMTISTRPPEVTVLPSFTAVPMCDIYALPGLKVHLRGLL